MRRCNRPITDHLCITCPYERSIDISNTRNSTAQLIWIMLIVLASFTFRLLSIVSVWFFFCYSFACAHIYEWMNGEWALLVSRKKMKQDIKTLPIRIFRTETRSTYIHTRDRIISNMYNTELGKYICEMSVWWPNRANENKK